MEVEDRYTGKKSNQYQHPYKTEIETAKYPPALYQKKEPIEYLPLDQMQPVWVDTQEELKKMLAELKMAEEIAVDLEHHDSRSYIGFVCLMQISTRKKDWIVDTLKLRGELQILNQVFCDPRIIKVRLSPLKPELSSSQLMHAPGAPRGLHGHCLVAT